MKLPTLYKKTSTGATQQWDISTFDNIIVTEYGQVGGAIQKAQDEVFAGKNIGKKNETTPTQQAEAEAQSQWEKKLKKGYVQTLDGAKAGERDAIITGGVDPMLAHRFDQHGGKLKYPCYVQPKLDGHRCIAVVDERGKCTLWSRTRKPITSMGHIITAIEAIGLQCVVLDGELYNHEYKNRFEELTSFIRDTKAKAGSEIVQYHIYDLAEPETEFYVRTRSLVDFKLAVPLVCVQTDEIEDEEELMLSFETLLKLGYEGAMARNSSGTYVGKRSYDLLKIKEFIDSEFEVVGVEEGRGKLAGHGIFVCKTPTGETFRTKMIGALADLKQYFDDPSLAVGRQLTVKYQGFTKYSIPRFPIAIRFKEEA